ncbi:MAG: hypothetical protein M8467_01750 [Anaerolineae bacterium]|nr:hypothetical protein [Anaerolineae bacterium]
MYYPLESWITPLTTIRRERLLPVAGEVLVGYGEKVGPADVVARCQVRGHMRVVDVSRALRVDRKRATKYVHKSPGETIQADEVLAGHGGLLGSLRSNVRSPVEGQIVEIRDGLVVIEAAPATLELSAHLKGQISNVMPKRGVVISAVGTLIQGLWGTGGEAEGVLKLLVDNPQSPLRASSIDVSCHGTVIVAGHILDEKALEQAIEAKVRGAIAGSVSAGLCPFLQSLPFPVLITNGFGSMAMSEPVFSLLHASMGREAMISTYEPGRWGGRRPEVIIPLRVEDEVPSQDTGPRPLKIGDRVRILREPHLGALGSVTALPRLPYTVESGARLSVAEVEFQDGDTAMVPLANVELIR